MKKSVGRRGSSSNQQSRTWFSSRLRGFCACDSKSKPKQVPKVWFPSPKKLRKKEKLSKGTISCLASSTLPPHHILVRRHQLQSYRHFAGAPQLQTHITYIWCGHGRGKWLGGAAAPSPSSASWPCSCATTSPGPLEAPPALGDRPGGWET